MRSLYLHQQQRDSRLLRRLRLLRRRRRRRSFLNTNFVVSLPQCENETRREAKKGASIPPPSSAYPNITSTKKREAAAKNPDK